MSELEKQVSITVPNKRILRQEAGFGCCKCGFPIYEYHHINPPSAEVKDLMILCPICHHEATLGAMSKKEQREWKSNPFNISNNYVEGKLKINQKALVINIGSNQFIGDGSFVRVDTEELLGVSLNSLGQIEISIKVYDKNNQLLVLIDHNEWISGDPLPWDFESSFQYIKLRRKLRDIVLEIDAREFPVNIFADLWYKKQNFQLTRDWIKFDGTIKNVGFKDLCFVGICLDAHTTDKKITLEKDKRFDEAKIVSKADIQRRIENGLEEWEILKEKYNRKANAKD